MPQQSPIDLTGAVEAAVPGLRFAYGPSRLEFLDKSQVVRVESDPPIAIELGGTRYPLRQFHLHAPSEHTLEGRRFAVEIHLVHETADDEKAVVAVFVDEGAPHPAAGELVRLLDGPPDRNVQTAPGAFDPAGLLPPGRASLRYAGSLTTPPYTEGVRWVVLTDPVHVSASQLAWLTGRLAKPARDLQDLAGRVIAAGTPAR